MREKLYSYIYSLPNQSLSFALKNKEYFDTFQFTKMYIDKPVGLLGIILLETNPLLVHQVFYLNFRSYPKGYLLDTPLKYIYDYDYTLEGIRELCRIVVFNIIKKTSSHNVIKINFHADFDAFPLEILIRSPKPIMWKLDTVGFFNWILYEPEISLEEYEKGLYPHSLDRIEDTTYVTEYEAQAILDTWLPTLEGETLLDFVTYLYPITQPKAKDEILADNERLWMYMYSLGMWYKLRYTLGKLYEDLEVSELSDFEMFLKGQDLPDSSLRQRVYEQLDCLTEEDFQGKLQEIHDFYRKMSDSDSSK